MRQTEHESVLKSCLLKTVIDWIYSAKTNSMSAPGGMEGESMSAGKIELTFLLFEKRKKDKNKSGRGREEKLLSIRNCFEPRRKSRSI